MIWDVGLIFTEIDFFLPWAAWWKIKEILKDICFLKMIPVVLAIELWWLQLRNKKVVLTLTTLHLLMLLINKSERLMELVRQFILGLVKNNSVF